MLHLLCILLIVLLLLLGLSLLNSYVSKDINLAHCKIIVFSEEVASEGISKEIFTFVNDIQLRPDTCVIVSRCDAKDYIENIKPDLESSVSQYYEITEESNIYTGFTDYLTIGDFYNCLSSNCCDGYAILGGINNGENKNVADEPSDSENDLAIKSSETPFSDEPSSENVGIAVFKDDKLVGELDAIQSICHLIVTDKFKSTVIPIKNPLDSNSTIDLYLYGPKKTKINVDIVNGAPYVTVDCKLRARVVSIDNISKDTSNDDETIDSITKAASEYLTQHIYDYLYTTCKIYKSDISKIGKSAVKNFSTNEKWENFDWLNNYKNSFFKVTADVNVKSGLILTEN